MGLARLVEASSRAFAEPLGGAGVTGLHRCPRFRELEEPAAHLDDPAARVIRARLRAAEEGVGFIDVTSGGLDSAEERVGERRVGRYVLSKVRTRIAHLLS